MATPATQPELSEVWTVLLWRQAELERAGYPTLAAMTLAEHDDVDLHEACDMLRRGATPELALAILT